MLSVFSTLRNRIVIKVADTTTDNILFRLHYRVTVLIIMACCILVTSRTYIGEHIQCIQSHPENKGPIPPKVLNNYCFIMSTFTVPKHYGKLIGEEVAHEGVGPHAKSDEVTFHAYYQWVPFVLFLQAITFYVPHYLWKVWEGGKIKAILMGMNLYVLEDDKRKLKENLLVEYIIGHLHSHNIWAIKFCFCEFLNFVVVVSNIYFTDFFLAYEFSTYGAQVVNFLNEDPEVRVDPMTRVFPRVTKCTFHKYGSSGTIQKHDALCILALNIINEKIYTVLWFWFIILAVLSALGLLWRLATIYMLPLRLSMLKNAARNKFQVKSNIRLVTDKCQIGDWLLIYFIGKNMDSLVFSEFLKELANSFTFRAEFPYSTDTKPMLA